MSSSQVRRSPIEASRSGTVLVIDSDSELSQSLRRVIQEFRLSLLVCERSTHDLKLFGAVALTQREREVLQLVAEGRTIGGIANILGITYRTAVFHKSNIMDKLGLRRTAELTCYAIQCGLLAAPESVFHRPAARTAVAAHA